MSALRKFKNLLKVTLMSCKKNGYLDAIKQSKLEEKFSECISELRLAPKLVSTMMEACFSVELQMM